MEFMSSTLRKYVTKNNGKLTPKKRKNLCVQILRAFRYLESKKLLHRDISPDNILLRVYEDTTVVKISDFGLVKVPESNLTSMNTEFKGSFNDRALIDEGFDTYCTEHETYALTRVLYFVITGRTNISKLSKKSKLNDFVQKGINHDQAKRFHSIDEMSSALRKCELFSEPI